ncbi:MAG TPA: histidine phosphotransferase family protein [Caulobacteraceae bacterium]|nr:histidine phosphotransferase family protein [Caulobacteraceae bacterium]
MTDVVQPDPPAATPAITADELAAKVAARLCHDFMSPASGIVSGLDLLDDPNSKDLREEAMNLIATSAKKLVSHLEFARVAFGAYAGAESFDSREIEGLARGVYAHVRPDLDWAVTLPQLPKAAARAVLNLAQIAAGALATGGTARITAEPDGGDIVVVVEACGPRVRLQPDIAAGLAGQPMGEGGLAGRWVQAYYLSALMKSAGGSVSVEPGEEKVRFTARAPA